MSCRCYDWENVYIKEKFMDPHCDTCECGRSELEITRTFNRPSVSHPVPHRKLPHRYLPEVIGCCPCKSIVDFNSCLCYECRKVRGRSEATLRKKQRGRFYEYKHNLLETWFDRFDSDGDGFLDLIDLEALLKYLGAKIRNSYMKKILQACDRDSDGRLSFPEFLHLWQSAAYHDEDFVRTTGCPDLSHIVKKYKLFPDLRDCSCQKHHCKHVTIATEHPIIQVKCKCGEKDKIIPFIKHEDKAHRPPKKVKTKKTAEDSIDNMDMDSDNLPTMSMNRDDIA